MLTGRSSLRSGNLGFPGYYEKEPYYVHREPKKENIKDLTILAVLHFNSVLYTLLYPENAQSAATF